MDVRLHFVEYFLHRLNNCVIFEVTYFYCFDKIVVTIICDDVILVPVEDQHGQRACRVRVHCSFSFSATAAKQNTFIFVGTPSEAVLPAAGCMSFV